MSTTEYNWKIVQGDSGLVATAIHDGHHIRSNASGFLALDEGTQLREEDPFTGELTEVADTRVVVERSRFEVDLNRPRERAIYRKPEDAWGITVWNDDVPEEVFQGSLEFYDNFNKAVFDLFDKLLEEHNAVVVYDLHSYNHRRNGPEGEVASLEENPEINVGTGNLNRERFGGVVDRFMADLSGADYLGQHLDVRENIKFKGGDFSRRLHERYGDKVCVIAVEFKKIFMDEWTGEVDPAALAALKSCLASTIPGVLEAVEELPATA